jgi:hypothetical protein
MNHPRTLIVRLRRTPLHGSGMKTPWPRFVSTTRDEPLKLLLLRLFIGGVLVYRESLNAWAAHYDPELSSRAPVPVFFVALGTLLLAGAGTRLCYLVMLLSYTFYNFAFDVMNLGPLFLVPLCWAGAVLDRDPLFSVDRRLLARSAAYRRIAQWPRAEVCTDDYNFVFGILFLIYAVNSLAALLFHLRDAYWQRGLTVQAMLTNNFFSRFFTVFRSVESWSARALALFSTASIVVQSAFQLLMLPLVFHRRGRWFVVVQGLAFFVFSLAFLQISLLPLIELAIWCVVFGSWIRRDADASANVRLIMRPARTAVVLIVGAASAIVMGGTFARWSGTASGFVPPALDRAMVYLSIWPPDVFNATDLKTGEQWYVIYRMAGESDDPQLVPVFTEEGRRLYYNLSDVIYYGNTLRWRRRSIGVANWDGTIPEYLIGPVERLCHFDFRVHGFHAPEKYVAYFYRDRSMNLDLPSAERYRKQLLATREFVITD